MSFGRLTLLAALSGQLERSLNGFSRDNGGIRLALPEPANLTREADRVALLFEHGAPREPDRQKRINALARLRRGETNLKAWEWTLITWGLCDDCGASGKPINEQPLFDAVMAHTDAWVVKRDVPRRRWFGLLHSYLSYDAAEPCANRNWLRLRERLTTTLAILTGSLKRPKLWSRLLETHRDIFDDGAGRSLRETVFQGSLDEQEQLRKGLPIPEASWLWQRIVAAQIEHLNDPDDAKFISAIPRMITFLRSRPLYSDDILAALLTRYCQSSHRSESHEVLKNEAFSRWKNPQLRSSTRWSMVEPPVRAMVLRWFAKEDLEHFFSLLQGSGQVDQARLRYWLRFVDQIVYTRILLGADAVNNPTPDFRNFRAKNAGRFGRLVGGQSHNNAFIMRINDQYFVEFSGTGNACYAYAEKELPFDPAAQELHANSALKKVLRDKQTWTDNRILHMNGWEWKADEFLARRNIRPGSSGNGDTRVVSSYQARFQSSEPLANTARAAERVHVPASLASSEKTSVPWVSAVTSTAGAVKVASALARAYRVETINNLDKGGAFWVLERDAKSRLGRDLAQLRMTFNADKGFWIK
jgi:hypothetical protein